LRTTSALLHKQAVWQAPLTILNWRDRIFSVGPGWESNPHFNGFWKSARSASWQYPGPWLALWDQTKDDNLPGFTVTLGGIEQNPLRCLIAEDEALDPARPKEMDGGKRLFASGRGGRRRSRAVEHVPPRCGRDLAILDIQRCRYRRHSAAERIRAAGADPPRRDPDRHSPKARAGGPGPRRRARWRTSFKAVHKKGRLVQAIEMGGQAGSPRPGARSTPRSGHAGASASRSRKMLDGAKGLLQSRARAVRAGRGLPLDPEGPDGRRPHHWRTVGRERRHSRGSMRVPQKTPRKRPHRSLNRGISSGETRGARWGFLAVARLPRAGTRYLPWTPGARSHTLATRPPRVAKAAQIGGPGSRCGWFSRRLLPSHLFRGTGAVGGAPRRREPVPDQGR